MGHPVKVSVTIGTTKTSFVLCTNELAEDLMIPKNSKKEVKGADVIDLFCGSSWFKSIPATFRLFFVTESFNVRTKYANDLIALFRSEVLWEDKQSEFTRISSEVALNVEIFHENY